MPRAIAVVGLGFGDEGKGSVVDYLVRKEGAGLVVRYNGGAQAAHNVVLPDGTHHTFAQFGAGTLAGARTHLSRFVLVNPQTMLREAAHLAELGVRDPLSLVSVEREALVTTRFHVEANRVAELARGDRRHGSCGMGIGETVDYALRYPDDALRVGDLSDPEAMRRKMSRLLDRYAYCAPSRESLSLMCEAMVEMAARVRVVDRDWLPEAMLSGTTVFEGAQGVLLDEVFGFAPHHTWSDCTFGNFERLVEGFPGEVRRLGVTRAYSTRHGEGPMPTEAEHPPLARGDHNGEGPWQGSFRAGPLDMPLLRYAAAVAGRLDGLCVTCVDRLCPGHDPLVCDSYEECGREAKNLVGVTGAWLRSVTPSLVSVPRERIVRRIGADLDLPIAVVSCGPTWRDKESF